jgi:hydrogenase expression/formation protein HypE
MTEHDVVRLSHGSGGRLTNDLITNLFVRCFDTEPLKRQDDAAVLTVDGRRLAFSTDSYVVDPIFFPGGNIGELAVNGTVNDLCMSGARPQYLSCGLIIEEGLPMSDLELIVESMKRAADTAGVEIVTGDTKVVDRGKGDKIFINTAGIGIVEHNYKIGPDCIKPGDEILINGPIASHGIAILAQREGLALQTNVQSDTAALNSLVAAIIDAAGQHVHAMRDPTRGGVAAAMNEFALASKVGIRLQEAAIPLDPAVEGACELLGIDPLYVASEGKVAVVAAPGGVERIVDVMLSHPLGKRTVTIGAVNDGRPGMVRLLTRLGGDRIVDMPVGEQLPRIC